MRRAAALLLTVGALLAGCAVPPAALPDGVTVSVFQNRFDYSERILELKVDNATDAPLTVTRAEFVSTRFVQPAVWDRPQTIPAGAARDLKVQLPEPVCEGGAAVDSVTLTVELPDGATATATLTPTDEQGRIDAINTEDCLVSSVAAVVAITPPDALEWARGAHSPAIVELGVEPTGAEGTATLLQAKGTVLLALSTETGEPVSVVPLDLVVDAQTAATSIRLPVVPNRCDAHAVEEDKRGTFFPLDVQTDDGVSGTIYIAVSDDVRRSLYEFYADYCGLPS